MDLEKSKQQQQQQHQQQMLLNSTELCVLESLRGFVGFHPTLRLLPGPHRIVLRWESVTRVGTSPEIGQEAGQRTGQKTGQGTSQGIGQGASQGIDQETNQETGQVTNQETGQVTSQENDLGTSQGLDRGTSHKNGRVAVISGGGAGHEPAHAGFVGVGMLSAAVSGHVFASPAPSAVLAAVRALAQSGAMGVLLVVKNYAGDRLNFGVAAERARAEGVEVETVVVADDCATPATRSDSEDEDDDDGVHDGGIDTDSELETDSEPHPEPEHDRDPSDRRRGNRRRGNRRSRRLHRRGLCGTLLVHKVAGALAEQGRPLSEVAREAWAAARATVTLAVGLSSCQVPGLALPRWSTPLQAGEMDLGVGIHGEAGAERVALAPARDVVRIMLERMVGDGGGGDNGDGGFAGGGNGGGTVGDYVGICAGGIGNVCGVDGVGDVAGGFGDDDGRSDDSTGYHGTQRIIERDSNTSSAVSRSSGTGLRVAGEAKLSDASGSHAGPPSARPVSCSAQGRLPLHRGERVALMVNNLGGTSHLELGVIAREAARQLGLRGVMVERSYVGTFMTALAMAGVSLTVMRLDHEGIRLHCLDVDTNAPSWPRVSWTSSLLSLSSAGRAYGDTCGGGHGGGQYVAEEEELEQGDALDEGRGQEKDHEKGHQQQEGHRQQKDCQQKEHQQKETVWDYHQEVGHEQGKSRRWAIEKMDEEADQGDSADRPEPPRLGHEARGLHGGQRGGEDDSDPGAPVRAAMTEVCEALLALESELNDLDSGSGDGDCGTSHARGARASLHWLRHLRANPRTASATIPGHLLRGLSELLEEDMGGTSGALYSLMLSAAAGALGSAPRPFPADWARAFAAAVRAVRRHGGARPGDRTMLDPLWAAHLELRVLLAGPAVGRRGFPMDGACGAEAAGAKESSGQEEEKEEAHVLNAKEVLARAVDRATAQALATAQMGARAGRARWARVGEAWGRVDPGARAVEVALKAVSFSLQTQGHW
ncbi:unnamed protein product [Lampetra fluviatilis]